MIRALLLSEKLLRLREYFKALIDEVYDEMTQSITVRPSNGAL
jgi:hypothetical protein